MDSIGSTAPGISSNAMRWRHERFTIQRRKVLCCNLGTGRGHSVREVIRAVEEVSGCKVPAKEAPRRPGDPPVLVAQAERAGTELGWRPRYAELRGIVETAWRWHSARPRGYGD